MNRNNPDGGASDTRNIRKLVYESLPLLLVEDDPLQRERLELVLSQANFDVIGVASVREARSAMEALVFPIVIVDRNLEDGDGIALIGELRKRYAQHRVYLMLLSALDSDDERRKGVEVGADDYLSKKTSDTELLQYLKAARETVRMRSR
jgi:two-component system OmpR family response regulator